jgi:hypothetical protein
MPEFLVGAVEMQNFVNREAELQLIEKQFDVLTEKNALVRTRIIEFYGVGGIGVYGAMEQESGLGDSGKRSIRCTHLSTSYALKH